MKKAEKVDKKRMTDINNRKFGVDDYDKYWESRRSKGRDSLRHSHLYLFELMSDIVPEGGKVLDCGTGDGNLFKLLINRFDVYGVEKSEEAILRYGLPKDRIIRHDLNKGIPDIGDKFDAIVASKVLHWLSSPPKFMDEIYRFLNPEGVFIPVIPNISYYRYRIQYFAGRFPNISPSHKNFQTPFEAEKMFKDAQFKITRITTSKKNIKARLIPKLFSRELIYVLGK